MIQICLCVRKNYTLSILVKLKLTMSSYASFTAVNANTPISGIAVVIGVSDEIAGINCSNSKHKK